MNVNNYIFVFVILQFLSLCDFLFYMLTKLQVFFV